MCIMWSQNGFLRVCSSNYIHHTWLKSAVDENMKNIIDHIVGWLINLDEIIYSLINWEIFYIIVIYILYSI